MYHIISAFVCTVNAHGFDLQAPAEVMAAFLTHLDERYGGPLGYLDSVGFSKKQQTRLRQAVCITGSQQAAL